MRTKISYTIKRATQNMEKSLVLLSLAIALVHWGIIVSYVVPRLGTLDFLRLHYTASLGVDWVGVWWHIFAYPFAGTVILLINTVLSRRLASYKKILGEVVLGVTVVSEVFLMTGGVMAVLLNS